MNKSYTPSDKILEKYAELLVNFGLQTRSGQKLKKGSVIRFVVPEIARPLYYHLQVALLKNGYHPLGALIPSNDAKYKFDKAFYEHASQQQLEFYANIFYDGLIQQIDGNIGIIANTDPHSLRTIDPKKVLKRSLAQKPYKDRFFRKVETGNLAWTLALYGTEAMAAEAGMSLKEYWQQIIKACYLDSKDPITKWHQINKTVQNTANKLTKLQIQTVRVVGEDIDLRLGIGSNRAWLAGGGNNIPSYEVFTSPNYREVEGWIKFNQPHYRYGKKIEGIELEFKKGKVVKAKATKNFDLLQSMLKTPGGNQLGEFSLTDARLSRITKFMAEILYDENTGGKYGNTHVALGSAYRDCYTGNVSKVRESDWDKLGYNNSVVHSDLISTTDRTVTATLPDGEEKIIYENGQFTI